jgi:hypothetical protein
MRYHAAPGSLISRLTFFARKGINLEWRKAWVQLSKQPRKLALSVSHFGISVPQRLWMQLLLTKSNAVKPPMFGGKI